MRSASPTRSRQVTLALFAVAPLVAISTMMIIKITTSQTARTTESYAKAGSVVSTTVRSIRTILSLNAVEDMIDRFKAATLEACEISRGSAASLGAANGFNVVAMVLSYMIVTMFGAWLLYSKVRSDGCDPSGAVPGAPTCTPSGNDVFGSLFAVSIAASILPQISIAIEKFSGTEHVASRSIESLSNSPCHR
jgi:ABC-type multidrug transport system fused ATPase/permease subunit